MDSGDAQYYVHGSTGYEVWGLPPEGDEVVLRAPLRLDLVEAHTYPTGTAIHVYRTRTV